MAAGEKPENWVDANEAATTHTCKTPGCPNESTSSWGRHSYCRQCQARRGTRRPDGSLVVSDKVRSAPGSKAHRERVGQFEQAALELAAAGRVLDEAVALVQAARRSLPPALDQWKATLARMPHTVTAATASADDEDGCR